MDTAIKNPCTRCGKERIESKSWTETLETFFGSTTVTHTETVCPDPECQKIVEEKLDDARRKKENLMLEREKRMNKNRKKN